MLKTETFQKSCCCTVKLLCINFGSYYCCHNNSVLEKMKIVGDLMKCKTNTKIAANASS